MTDAHTRNHSGNHAEKQDGNSSAGDTAGGAYNRTLEKATHTLESSRDFAADAARKTVASIDANPLGILVGGLALGAVAGALLPRSERERELLAPVGAKLGERARGAFTAARDAGKSELDELGISQDAAKDQVRTLFDGVMKALTAAGAAGAAAAKSPPGSTGNQ